jgi:hypothetical protein
MTAPCPCVFSVHVLVSLVYFRKSLYTNLIGVTMENKKFNELMGIKSCVNKLTGSRKTLDQLDGVSKYRKRYMYRSY